MSEARNIEARNTFWLDGILLVRDALRYTPAGIPVATGVIAHQSSQCEADAQRTVNVEVNVLAAGDMARLLEAAPVGTAIRAEGFVAAKSLRDKALVLHLTTIEFLEGNQHGLQAQVQVQEKG